MRTATLRISGLGVYDAWINGRHITCDQELSPTVSDYRKRVYFNEFDVKSALRKGQNALAVSLGCGRFTAMREPGMRGFGVPRLWLQLDIVYADGRTATVVSDESWKISCEGPIRANNEFDGETYDARKELKGWTKAGYDDSSWQSASLMSAPGGKLVLQPNPNIAVQDIVRPVSITKTDHGYILDMGQNMVGRLQIKARGLQRGDTLTMKFAEILNSDGTLYLANIRTAKVLDTYVAKDGKPVVWHPKYVYHGFRFVEVKGLPAKRRCSNSSKISSLGESLKLSISSQITSTSLSISRCGKVL